MPELPAQTDVVIVGAGQAGLSMSHRLVEAGIEHLLLERAVIGHEWRASRWDSFCLVTPNWQCQLPGFPYSGDDPDGFMVKDQIVEYVTAYAASFGPPVYEGVAVTGVRGLPADTFAVTTSSGSVRARAVVVATGGYHLPIVPAFAAHLDPAVAQLHSSEYRNPGQLSPGAVLVVGSGQSGAQLAEDLLLAGRRVHLAVGDAPRCARFYRGRDVVAWLHDMGQYDLPVEEHPLGLSAREKTNHYVTGRDGGRDIDLRSFALAGMQLHGRLASGAGSRLAFAPTLRASLDTADAVYNGINASIDRWIETQAIAAPPPSRYQPVWEPATELADLDLRQAGITSIIWAIGYRPDYSWLQLPVLDDAGRPRHTRGVSSVPGLFFLGLPWQHTWGSGRFASVGRDADYLSTHLGRLLCQPVAALRSTA